MSTGGGRLVRGLALHILIGAMGLGVIVGSGGGGGALGFPDLSCLNTNSCPGGIGNTTFPFAQIFPGRVTTQVGGTVSFTVATNVEQASYQWCRQPASGAACTPIAGATQATYTLTGANLNDDGATFSVAVNGSNGSAQGYCQLAVSSMPGVIYQDGDFLDTDWAVNAVAVPPQGGPTASATRAASGGNPGAFRTADFVLPLVPSSVRIFYGARSAVYDPVTLGAVYRMDFAEDCISRSSTGLLPYTAPLIEQSGRRFIASTSAIYCGATHWSTVRRSSLGADDFEFFDGPACAAGEPCPNFSANGAPIRLGLVGGATLSNGLPPPVQTAHGFDNWKVTVWRR